jgi:hypothetical protein
MSGGHEIDFQDRRLEAVRRLGPELQEHLRAVSAASATARRMLEAIPKDLMRTVPPSLAIAIKLLMRLFDDVECVAILAMQGYPVQSLELVAAMHEVAYTVAFVGNDETRARTWLEHDDPTQAFRSAYDLTLGGLTNLGVPDPQALAAQEYRNYRQLCWAKHANPILETRWGVGERPGAIVLSNGPDWSEPAVRAAWFGLEAAVGYIFVATTSLGRFHLVGKIPDDIADQVQSIGMARERLNAAAKARWPQQTDPFLGRW